MSGQYPARVGITDFIAGHLRPWAKLENPVNRTQYLPLEVETIAERLKAAGYTTGAFGKWHLGGREHFPDKQGFDTFLTYQGRHFGFKTIPPMEVPEGAYLADLLTDQAIEFMTDNKDEPFFVYLSHYAVHIPLEAKADTIAKYEAKEKPAEGINNPIYAAMIEHVDESVGRVMESLDELGVAENTIVIFFSDNGGLLERFDKSTGVIVTTNAPLRDEKGTLYEGGVREPLIVRWPARVEAGSVSNEVVTSVDFYPTLLELAGAEPLPETVLDGESLASLLSNKGAPEREAVYWHYPHYHHSTPASSIRKGDWKLIEFFEDGRVELYNLVEDISEENNLAETKPELAEELQQDLAAWRESVNAVIPEPNPNYDPNRAEEWGKRQKPKKKPQAK
jgi:uncharacterized sulfatase